LASLSDEAAIILSTHIVEDVSDLCPNMAIMAGGRIVLEGNTSELIGRLDGIVWRKVVSRTEVAEHQSQYRVIATRLFAGETVLHVLSETDPANGFLPLQQGLEELYMATIQQDRAVDRRTA
jgi:ABC-type multidrug transport system ATPase subunit